MIGALVFKEWREHRWVAAAVWVLTVGFGMLQGWRELDAGSPFVPFHRIAPFAIVLLGLAFANRLVVREYTGRTQLFLEALPLTRATVLGTKWVLGALGVWFPLVAMLALTTWWGGDRTVVTADLVSRIASRALVFALFFHALAFTVGLLGRYRYVTWGALLAGVFATDRLVQVAPQQMLPLRLLAASMIVESEPMPWADLATTLALICALVGIAGILALVREGAWVAAFAHRMSRREKVGILVATLVPLALVSVLDRRKEKPRFDLVEAVRAQVNTKGLVVGVSRPPSMSEAEAAELGNQLVQDLETAAEWLEVKDLPAVFVLADGSLDSDVFLRADLPESDGVVLKGALGTSDFDVAGFRTFAVHEVLTWYGNEHPKGEKRHWLLDGFAAWWVAKSDPRLTARIEARADAATHLLPLEPKTFERWDESQERLGECLANALAYRAVSLLVKRDGARALIREVLGQRPPKDARAAFMAIGPTRRLLEALGAALEGAPKTFGPEPSFMSWKPHVEAQPLSGRLNEVRFRVERPAEDASAPFAMRYLELGPWDDTVFSARRFDTTRDGVLPLTVPSGARLYTSLDRHDDALQCTVRLDSRRWEVP